MTRRTDDDVLDERGLLRDGQRLRVPLAMMDDLSRSVADGFAVHQSRVVDGLGRPAGHRPGACYLRAAPHTTDHAVAVMQDHLRREARDEFIRELCDAWKGDTSDREVARVHNTGDTVRDAYLDQVADMTSAWERRR
jgi:hypothetical protein